MAMAEAGADRFYGAKSLNSLVAGEQMTLNLPGGARMAIANQETNYTLTDHLQSGRMAVKADNSISEPVAYTPFGDAEMRVDDLNHHYTGQTFAVETATYDYHARGYDTSINRFLSVDAKRQAPSPYVYVNNNPINRIDPSGNLSLIHISEPTRPY